MNYPDMRAGLKNCYADCILCGVALAHSDNKMPTSNNTSLSRNSFFGCSSFVAVCGGMGKRMPVCVCVCFQWRLLFHYPFAQHDVNNLIKISMFILRNHLRKLNFADGDGNSIFVRLFWNLLRSFFLNLRILIRLIINQFQYNCEKVYGQDCFKNSKKKRFLTSIETKINSFILQHKSHNRAHIFAKKNLQCCLELKILSSEKMSFTQNNALREENDCKSRLRFCLEKFIHE